MKSSESYLELVYKVADLFDGPLTSIEILPGGLKEWVSIELPPEAPKPSPDFPFVFLDGNLGIPKKVMYALYLAASAMPWRFSNPKEVNAATISILILNPAHQSALNARKRLLQQNDLDAEKELVVTELLLRGLTECAKQSILWDHRRWFFKQIYDAMGLDVSIPPLQHWATSEEAQFFPKITPAAIRHEFDIIHHTCETYPRNYHAWAHWHWIIDVTLSSIHIDRNGENRGKEFILLLLEANTRLRNWIDYHPSDYSAIHQLCQSQDIIDQLIAAGLLTEDDRKDLPSMALVDHSLSLVKSYPAHESLWMYLRVALGKSDADRQMKILRQVESDYTPNAHASKMLAWFSRSRVS